MVVRHGDVGESGVTRVRHRDPVAESGAIGANAHANGGLLSGQVRIESFARTGRVANHLLVHLERIARPVQAGSQGQPGRL